MPFFGDSGSSIPYPDITGVDSISDPDYIQFSTTATATNEAGRLSWDSTNGALKLGLFGDNISVAIGEELVTYARNDDSVTLVKGDVVYLSGAVGDKPAVIRASNVGNVTSATTFGIVAETIAPNELGYVVTRGALSGLNLGGYTTGDIVWLDSTAGDFTNVKPAPPAHSVFLGVVLRANPGNGAVYIAVQNGYELEELHNVLITSPAPDDVLTWDDDLNLWVNKPATVSGLTDLSNVVKYEHSPSSGIDIFNRQFINATLTLINQVVHLTFFTPLVDITVSSFTTHNGNIGSASATLIRMGLYTWDGTTATLVARTANDTTMFNTFNAATTRVFSTVDGYPATYTLTAGQRYAVAVLQNGGTQPNLYINSTNIYTANVFAPRIVGRVTGQTDLPASIAAASINDQGAQAVFVRLT
jgi:hypothetical protein